jgi:hypothetical protein
LMKRLLALRERLVSHADGAGQAAAGSAGSAR